jgi:hypothetical protein
MKKDSDFAESNNSFDQNVSPYIYMYGQYVWVIFNFSNSRNQLSLPTKLGWKGKITSLKIIKSFITALPSETIQVNATCICFNWNLDPMVKIGENSDYLSLTQEFYRIPLFFLGGMTTNSDSFHLQEYCIHDIDYIKIWLTYQNGRQLNLNPAFDQAFSCGILLYIQ